jgi:hypothetical protein
LPEPRPTSCDASTTVVHAADATIDMHKRVHHALVSAKIESIICWVRDLEREIGDGPVDKFKWRNDLVQRKCSESVGAVNLASIRMSKTSIYMRTVQNYAMHNAFMDFNILHWSSITNVQLEPLT